MGEIGALEGTKTSCNRGRRPIADAVRCDAGGPPQSRHARSEDSTWYSCSRSSCSRPLCGAERSRSSRRMRCLRSAALLSAVAAVAVHAQQPEPEPEPEPEVCHDGPVCVENTWELVHLYGFPCSTDMAAWGLGADARHPRNVFSEYCPLSCDACAAAGYPEPAPAPAPPPPPASPFDCVGSWQPWSECDRQCGPGHSRRFYRIASPAKAGGSECSVRCTRTFPPPAHVAIRQNTLIGCCAAGA